MELLKVNFHSNEVIFSYNNVNKNLNNFINSNNIYNNELLYSFSYVNKNINKIREIIKNNFSSSFGVKFIFSNEQLFMKIVNVIQNINFPVEIEIKDKSSLSYETYKKCAKEINDCINKIIEKI